MTSLVALKRKKVINFHEATDSHQPTQAIQVYSSSSRLAVEVLIVVGEMMLKVKIQKRSETERSGRFRFQHLNILLTIA